MMAGSDEAARLLHALLEVLSAATDGDCSQRVQVDQDTEPLAEVAHGLNRLLDLVESSQRDVVGASTAAARGRVDRMPMAQGLPGDFKDVAESVGAALSSLSTQTEQLGRLETRLEQVSERMREAVAGQAEELLTSAHRVEQESHSV